MRPKEATVAALADFPPPRDLPASFHPAAAAVPDFVVQVDGRAHMARHQPDFLSDLGRSIDLYVAVLLIQLTQGRSEEHTSELQSRRDLVCRLLLEKKNAQRRDAEQYLRL